MSKYTIELGEVIEDIWDKDHEGYEPLEEEGWETALQQIDAKIEYARPKIFSFTYEYYGTSTDKTKLERDILSDYYFREINVDNFVKWQMMLRNRLHKIMPKYIGMYNAQMKLLASDFLNPYEIEEERKNKRQKLKDIQGSTSMSNNTTTENSSNSSGNTNVDGKDVTDSEKNNKFYNTPQAMMQSGHDYLTNMTTDDNTDTNTYNSNTIYDNTGKSKSQVSDSGLNTTKQSDSELNDEDYTRLVKGNLTKYNYGELTEAYNRAILNIEHMIVDDLNDLFYMIY